MDPGWKPAWRGVWRVLVPGFIRSAGRRPNLIVLRAIWLSMLVSWALFAVVLSFLGEERERQTWVYAFVPALAVVDLGLLVWLRGRPLRTDSAHSLANSYSQALFIGFALTGACVLYGFVGFFIGGGMPAYLLGLPFGLAGFALMAPSTSNIRRAQLKLRHQGSSLSLYDALSAADQPPSETGTPPFP